MSFGMKYYELVSSFRFSSQCDWIRETDHATEILLRERGNQWVLLSSFASVLSFRVVLSAV